MFLYSQSVFSLSCFYFNHMPYVDKHLLKLATSLVFKTNQCHTNFGFFSPELSLLLPQKFRSDFPEGICPSSPNPRFEKCF